MICFKAIYQGYLWADVMIKTIKIIITIITGAFPGPDLCKVGVGYDILEYDITDTRKHLYYSNNLKVRTSLQGWVL